MWKQAFQIFLYLFAAIGVFFIVGYLAVRFGLTNQEGIIDTQRQGFLNGINAPAPTPHANENVPWPQSEEWQVLATAISRDQEALTRAATDSGVPARLIVANLVAEQLRLFFTEREFYKQFFYPLKILGSQTQFSWGVMGMKEATAIQVEQHLVDPASPYYLGPEYEHRLDFVTSDPKSERFTRMTDQKDHYWSYLYAGLYLKQIMAQWERAGYPIGDNPAVLSTLYNIGFANSSPKPNPAVGGAAITVGPRTYSFGGLAAEFYQSDLLISLFPRS